MLLIRVMCIAAFLELVVKSVALWTTTHEARYVAFPTMFETMTDSAAINTSRIDLQCSLRRLPILSNFKRCLVEDSPLRVRIVLEVMAGVRTKSWRAHAHDVVAAVVVVI